MRIALVSTPFVAVPPPAYGGTELVVSELALALRALGHEVVVYATGDSALPGIEIRHYFPSAVWPPEPSVEETHAAWCMRDILRDARGFDAIHSHCTAFVSLSHHFSCPVLHTVHHDVDPAYTARYLAAPEAHLIAISHSQARKEPAPIEAVVHHGLDPARFTAQPDGGYLLFLGRYDRCKGPDLALDVAEGAGLSLVLAGKPHEPDFWDQEIAPRLRGRTLRDVGPVGGARKAALLARARALVFPIRWDEPFGLVMIEAMLSGVPVLALSRGSVPEIVDAGVTGVPCETLEELVAAARTADAVFDRRRVRAHARQRWSSARMARDYLELYAAYALEKPARSLDLDLGQPAADGTSALS
ncbi:MAG: glycosyltransferase family 4 protein [Myxococcales bacterium]